MSQLEQEHFVIELREARKLECGVTNNAKVQGFSERTLDSAADFTLSMHAHCSTMLVTCVVCSCKCIL